MRIQHFVLPTLCIAGAAAILWPARTEAFDTIGGSLGTTQRDFRIFNNFTDAAANNNTTIHPQFPGWTGAYVAIWKGMVEWGSRLHGDGSGDPQQVNNLGSGGANFDAMYAGSANTTGGTNDNIHSELTGSSGGVLAFCETPISDGWRIRYYQSWTWADGPNTGQGGSVIDLQGVACHEYGHALGLGHSAVNGATMEPSITGNGEGQRSISADDIAGVQFVYGVASASKPIINSISTGPGTVTINGSNFSASGNQVWFTSNLAASTGIVTVVNVTGSANQITVSVPANAGPGDIMVKNNTTGNASLSNAFPFNPDVGPPCNPPANVCFTSPNSVGPGANIGWFGSYVHADNDFHLLTTGLPPGSSGIYYYGLNETFAAFGNGFRCVSGSVIRLPLVNASVFGEVQWDFDLTPTSITPGATRYFQYWYRNPAAGGAGFNLSDALQVTFCP